jgi:hypothetical protein
MVHADARGAPLRACHAGICSGNFPGCDACCPVKQPQTTLHQLICQSTSVDDNIDDITQTGSAMHLVHDVRLGTSYLRMPDASWCAEVGNTSSAICFHTLSGPLTVSQLPQDGSNPIQYEMALPVMAPSDPPPPACSRDAPLVQALACGLKGLWDPASATSRLRLVRVQAHTHAYNGAAGSQPNAAVQGCQGQASAHVYRNRWLVHEMRTIHCCRCRMCFSMLSSRCRMCISMLSSGHGASF